MNIIHKMKVKKADRFGHILGRSCILEHNVEGKIEGRIELTGRRGRRRKPLLGDPKDTRRCCKLNEEALDHIL
jgi:hypothetical protein